MITRDTKVEELMELPGLVTWFIQRGVSPFSCSGAFPGTLGKLLELKGVKDVDRLLEDLNEAFQPQAG